jgi:hypothetical protein
MFYTNRISGDIAARIRKTRYATPDTKKIIKPKFPFEVELEETYFDWESEE